MKISRLCLLLVCAAALACSRKIEPPSPEGSNVVEELRSGDPGRRVAAAESIYNLAAEGMLEAEVASDILPSLHDRNRFVRASIVSALGAVSPPSKKVAVALWERLLRDPSSAVRKLAASSLLAQNESHSKILSADPQAAQRLEHRSSPFASLRPPVGWIVVEPYRVSSPELECARRTDRSWEAGFLAGDLKIRRLAEASNEGAPFSRPGEAAAGSKVQPVEDGWLFASGETLSWYSLDGRHRRPVASGQFTGFLKDSDAILAFRSLPYPASRQGEILSVSRSAPGVWAARLVESVDFPIIDAVEDPSGSIFFLTTDTLEVWSPNGEMRRAHVGAWGELEPQSLALAPNGALYVGMKHGVAMVTPAGRGYFEQWLVPLACPVNTKNGVCGCFGNEPDDQTVNMDLQATPTNSRAIPGTTRSRKRPVRLLR